MRLRRAPVQCLAIALCLCLLALPFLTPWLAAAHAHQHFLPHADCSVCAQIQFSRAVIKALGLLMAAGGWLCAAAMPRALVRPARTAFAVAETPISRKNRMND